MIYRILLFFSLVCLTPSLSPAIQQMTISEAETLAVRRIQALWTQGTLDLVIREGKNFFTTHPHSSYGNQVHIYMGRACMDMQLFTDALPHFRAVNDPSLQQELMKPLCYCMWQLGHWEAIEELLAGEVRDITLGGGDWTQDQCWVVLTYTRSRYQRLQAKHEGSEACLAEMHSLLPYLERLKESPYHNEAMMTLASVYESLGNLPAAKKAYLLLQEPSAKDQLRIAKVEAQMDPELALEHFRKLRADEPEVAQESLSEEIALLYSQKADVPLSELSETLQAMIPAELSPSSYLYTGYAAYRCKQYTKALALLEGFLGVTPRQHPQHSIALQAVLASAYEANDAQALAGWTDVLENSQPDDAQVAHWRRLQAQSLNRGQKYKEALHTCERMLKRFPSSPERAELLYQRATALHGLHVWDRALDAWHLYLTHFPESRAAPQAWQSLLLSCFGGIQEGVIEVKRAEKWIQRAFSRGNLTPNQKANFQYRLAQCWLAREDWERAAQLLSDLLDLENPEVPAAKIHYLLAWTLRQQGDLEGFTRHGELALKAEDELPDPAQWRVYLFHACTVLSKEARTASTWDPQAESQAKIYQYKAAEHLHTAWKGGWKLTPRQLEWLANFYHERSSYSPAATSIANELYAAYLGGSQELIQASQLAALCRWAETCRDLGANNQAIEILEPAFAWCQEQPEQAGPQAAVVMWLLAQTYEDAGWIGSALETLDRLRDYRSALLPIEAARAQLAWARLAIKTLEPEEHILDHPLAQAILEELKDLKAHKKLQQEPVHLEAAIEYADFFASLQSEADETVVLLKTLQEIRQEFTEEEDLLSKDYHADRKVFEKQDQIFQAYLILMDARIALAQSQQDHVNDSERQRYAQAASELFLTLREKPFAISNYILDQANWGLRKGELSRQISFLPPDGI